MVRLTAFRRLAVLPLTATLGCTSVARVVNPAEPSCQATLRGAFDSILVEEGETAEVAASLSEAATAKLGAVEIGPRPFVLSSPSGADYAFFFESEEPACLMRLYGRQKGFLSYTNNLTHIATRPLPGCGCAE